MLHWLRDVSHVSRAWLQCHPECRWQCDDPMCPAVCHPVCERPRCQMQCAATQCAKCTVHCEKPVCSVRCPKNMCERESCPKCETVCQPAQCHTTCVAPEPVCSPVCEETKCDWKCKKPERCPRPKCQLQCQKSACEAAAAAGVSEACLGRTAPFFRRMLTVVPHADLRTHPRRCAHRHL
jgi:hypothetical protein